MEAEDVFGAPKFNMNFFILKKIFMLVSLKLQNCTFFHLPGIDIDLKGNAQLFIY